MVYQEEMNIMAIHTTSARSNTGTRRQKHNECQPDQRERDMLSSPRHCKCEVNVTSQTGSEMPAESVCQNNTVYVLKILPTAYQSPFTYRKTPCSPEYNVSVATTQESPAVADKPARRDSMPKIAQNRRA